MKDASNGKEEMFYEELSTVHEEQGRIQSQF
jgi:hypothetical protein